MIDLNIQKNSFSPLKSVPRSGAILRFIFLGLGLILLVELIYAIKVLTLPASPSIKRIAMQSVQLNKKTITLSAPQNIYRINEVIPVTATIDTGAQLVDGVDLLIHYDPKILEVTSSGLIKGRILEEYPTMTADASKGLISISGISNLRSGFKGKGQFAIINFKAKALGKTALNIDFNAGSTTDSNLVEAGTSKDILERVVNLELVVQ